MNDKTGSKAAIIISNIISKIEIAAGIVITFLFGITFIYGIFQPSEEGDVAAAIICGIITFLGVLLIIKGKRTGKLVKAFKSYVLRLSEKDKYTMHELAASTGESVDQVRNNIQQMIKKKFFINASLNNDMDTIVFPERKQKLSNSQVDDNVEYISVECTGCGAVNKIIKGTVGECEFCGTPLK